jgi:hypothetical protein
MEYRVLGLSPSRSLTDKEVRDAYYRLAKANHPDTSINPIEAAVKFRQIAAAYEAIKSAERRHSLALEDATAGDDAFSARMRGSSRGSNHADYRSTWTSIDEEMKRAEGRAGSRANQRRFFQAFETLIHPKVLFFLLPATIIGYMAVSTGIKKLSADLNRKPAESVSVERGTPLNPEVDAWFNPKSNRYETAAPWDPAYLLAVKKKQTVKMKRDLIAAARRP